MPAAVFRTYNPNPISKMVAVLILGFTILHPLNDIGSIAVASLICSGFLLVGQKREAIFSMIVFLILIKVPSMEQLSDLPVILMMPVSLLFVMRMFYLPYLAGKFLIKTSDVGSILTSLDKLKIPKVISIPIAVMFRFFPSFKEERANIKLAMRIRGISFINPFAYLEYIMVPLLIVSSNIADDIAKAAEVKCIENPINKNRYKELRFGMVDIAYLVLLVSFVAGGLIW